MQASCQFSDVVLLSVARVDNKLLNAEVIQNKTLQIVTWSPHIILVEAATGPTVFGEFQTQSFYKGLKGRPLCEYRKSSIKPPGGLFNVRPQEGGRGVNRDGGLFNSNNKFSRKFTLIFQTINRCKAY